MSKQQLIGGRDILLSTNLSILVKWIQHYNSPAVSLYDHPPEVSNSVLHWVLCHYERTLVLVALNKIHKQLGKS